MMSMDELPTVDKLKGLYFSHQITIHKLCDALGIDLPQRTT